MLAVGLISTLSCGREVTGPEGGRLSRLIAIQPMLRVQSGVALVSSGIDFARLRLTLTRLDGTSAYDRVLDFPDSADSLQVSASVVIRPDAPPEGERLAIALTLITSEGDTVFRSRPDTLQLAPGPTNAPPVIVDIELEYTGPGAEATRVVLTPVTAETFAGNALAFTAEAFNDFNESVPDAPILFTSSDTLVMRFADARNGAATAGSRRGNVLVIASLLTDASDSARVKVLLPATTIAAQSGSGQSAVAGAAVLSPVVARVTASDGGGVPGVAVTFAASNGGAVASPTVVTDTSGFASTTWTLGPSAGAQTVSASASALSGSPVVFTATAVSSPATQLVFTASPSTQSAGASLGSITVEARDAAGLVDVGFSGVISLAIGTNPGGGTLGGTVVATASAGRATFAGVSIAKSGVGYTLVASAGALTSLASAPFTITPGPATQLAFTTQPSSGIAGDVISPAVVVSALDAFANVAAFSGVVTVAAGANPVGATLSGSTTATAVAGVATFAGLRLNFGGVGFTLTASATGLTSAVSNPFNSTGALIEWANGAGGNWSVPANWSLGRVPQVADTVVIALPGTYTVTLDTTFTGRRLTVGGGAGTQKLTLASRSLTLSGPLSVQPSGALALHQATIAAALVNAGTVLASGKTVLNGSLTTTAGSLLRVAALVPGDTNRLTVATGFTNNGSIELTKLDASGAWSSSLVVTSGTLVNAVGGSITALFGTVGGGTVAGDRSIHAALDNRGVISAPDANADLYIYTPTDAVSENTGAITLSASGSDLWMFQSPTGTGSFTNRGTITIPTGRAVLLNSGRYTHAAGAALGGDGLINFFDATVALQGDVTLDNLTFGSGSVELGVGANLAVTSLALFSGATLSGPGTLTIGAGRGLYMAGSTVTAAVVNSGLIEARGASRLDGPITTTATSHIALAVDPSATVNMLTIANGFVNQGTITIENDADWSSDVFDQRLTVSAGTLVNASGATIRARRGAGRAGPRTLNAQLDNQGTIEVFADTAGLFTIVGNVLTSGTISVAVGGLSAGTQHGQLAVTGTLSLGGTLNVGLFGGYVPVSGNSFTVLTSTGARTGTFATSNLTAPLTLPVSYSANAVSVGVP